MPFLKDARIDKGAPKKRQKIHGYLESRAGIISLPHPKKGGWLAKPPMAQVSSTDAMSGKFLS